MNNELTIKPPMLVVMLPGNEYQRFIGKTKTHHVLANERLTSQQVEQFRVAPESMMEPEEA